MLEQAERLLIVAGVGIINADAADLLVEFARAGECAGRRTARRASGRCSGAPTSTTSR